MLLLQFKSAYMGLPFNYISEVTAPLPENCVFDDSGIVQAYREELQRLKAKDIESGSDFISFKGSTFRFVFNWNLLVPISKGVLKISKEGANVSVRYYIEYTDLLILSTLIVLLMGGIFMLASGADVKEGLLFVVASWLWLFGGNLIITMFRFPAFIRKTLNRHLIISANK